MKNELEKFGHALRGWRMLATQEAHGRFHHLALVLATLLGWFVNLSRTEWLALVICSAGVIGSEAINSAIEALADVVQPNHDPRIKRVKDLAAGAVLVFSLAAAVVGLLIFVPHLLT